MATFVAVVLAGCGDELYMPVTGTIYGTVFQTSGDPAEGTRVIVEGTGLSAVADSRGRFVVNAVPSVRPGRIGATYDIRGELQRDGRHWGFVRMYFKVKEQQSYSIGTVTLQETGSIRGTVTLDGETDASGVRVRLEGLSLEAVTNAAGAFLLDRVPAFDDFTVICEHAGFAPATLPHVAVAAATETTIGPTGLRRTP